MNPLFRSIKLGTKWHADGISESYYFGLLSQFLHRLGSGLAALTNRESLYVMSKFRFQGVGWRVVSVGVNGGCLVVVVVLIGWGMA